jgi:hypothetical protein
VKSQGGAAAPPIAETIMNETPKSKRGWRILRRILIALATLATLIAILYAEEDWRGKRAWENYQRELEAKGEVLDWNAYIPAPVPDDQNFFRAPVFAGSFNDNWDENSHSWKSATNVVDRLKINVGRSDGSWPDGQGGNWTRATLADLKPWQTYYRALAKTNSENEFPVAPQPQTPAADVLLALSKYNSTIEELRQAGRRPASRLPLNYENRTRAASEMLPLLADLKRCVQVLQLRASAELQNGESEKALDDVKLMLRLNDSLRTEPYLISDLVRIAVTSITLQPIYEGLAKHQWTEAQLVELDQALAKVDFLTDFQSALRSERAGSIANVDYFRQRRLEFIQLLFAGNRDVQNDNSTWEKAGDSLRMTGIYLGFYLMPGGWLYENELAIAQTQQLWDSKMVDVEQRTVSPETMEQAGKSTEGRRVTPWNFLSRESLSAIAGTARKSARIQVEVDLARTACALERYRLAHGEYPETLDALMPQFVKAVPNDIFGGKPLRYRLNSDGNFVLYSIGWNEKDDGGFFSYPSGSSMPRFEQGDWVWQYPVK